MLPPAFRVRVPVFAFGKVKRPIAVRVGGGQFRADLVGLAGVEDHAVEPRAGPLLLAMAEGRDDRWVDV